VKLIANETEVVSNYFFLKEDQNNFFHFKETTIRVVFNINNFSNILHHSTMKIRKL